MNRLRSFANFRTFPKKSKHVQTHTASKEWQFVFYCCRYLIQPESAGTPPDINLPEDIQKKIPQPTVQKCLPIYIEKHFIQPTAHVYQKVKKHPLIRESFAVRNRLLLHQCLDILRPNTNDIKEQSGASCLFSLMLKKPLRLIKRYSRQLTKGEK